MSMCTSLVHIFFWQRYASLYYQGRKKSDIRNSLQVNKYYHKSHYLSTMVFKIISVQRILRIATAVTIKKKHMWNRMVYMVIFSPLEGISKVVMSLIVHWGNHTCSTHESSRRCWKEFQNRFHIVGSSSFYGRNSRVVSGSRWLLNNRICLNGFLQSLDTKGS